MDQAKRTAVITGAARGIGGRTAEVLAGRGYNLARIDLQIPEETLKSVESRGVEALGCTGSVADNVSKHGLIGLTRTLAAEWGGRGLRVNAVCAAGVKTICGTR